MTDLPALVVEAEDVPMESVIAQLRAIASGMEASIMDDVSVTLALTITFRRAEHHGSS